MKNLKRKLQLKAQKGNKSRKMKHVHSAAQSETSRNWGSEFSNLILKDYAIPMVHKIEQKLVSFQKRF